MKSTNLRILALTLASWACGQVPIFGADDKDTARLAALIDQKLAAVWRPGFKPAPRADDAEFFRRVHLDLTGRIPSIIEIRDFLDDTRPEKRAIWVERILQSALDDPSYRDAYSNHFATVWRSWLLGQPNQLASTQQVALERWLKKHLKANAGYDLMVRGILLQGPANSNANVESIEGSPTAFFLTNELQPENLAASTARLFLGIKLECAQCHAHPFAKWTREQFWEYAAFFADVPTPARPGQPAAKKDPRTGIRIIGTDKVVKARFLDGKLPQWKDEQTRPALADWMLSSDNPYFARATVNRLWAYFFGVGLVEQLDEPLDGETANHTALLGELAQAFVASNYDLKFLIQSLVATQAYQRTSTVSPADRSDQRLFARMPLRGLSPEQLFDSLAVATECTETTPVDPSQFLLGDQSPRSQFLAKFPNQEQITEYQTSILQALYLMNNAFIARQTSVIKNQTLATLAEQQTGTAGKVESLFLVVLSRKPRPDETARFAAYVDSGDVKTTLADVFWILLNSPEFILNH
jgi:hypothetical protein